MTNKITKDNLIETLLHPINKFKQIGEQFHKDNYIIYFNFDFNGENEYNLDIIEMIDNNISYTMNITHRDFNNEILPFLQRNIDIKPIPEESIEEWFSKLNTKLLLMPEFRDIKGRIGHRCYALCNGEYDLMSLPHHWGIERIKSAILKGIEIYESK